MVRTMNPGNILAVGTRDLLYRMAQDIGPAGWGPSFGFGMLRLPKSFLEVLKSGSFAGANSTPWTPDGTYDNPYSSLASALTSTADGGTIVLNGGVGGALPPNYPAQIITKPITLRAFPDRPVTIGN